MFKSAIRKRILSYRDALSSLEVASLSEAVVAQFLASPAYSAAATVALYSSIRSEVVTSGIFAAARNSGRKILYPRTVASALEFVEVQNLDILAEARFGIMEPVGGESFPLSAIDLIVLPGVAFDANGIRLGYGMGCYDRALAVKERPILVGLAYDFQIVPSLPQEEHDIPVDIIVTESRILTMQRSVTIETPH